MNDETADTVKPDVPEASRASILEQELWDAIGKRDAKTKFPPAKVKKFVKDTVRSVFDPGCNSGVLLGRINNEGLHLLSDATPEQFNARLERYWKQARQVPDAAAEVQPLEPPVVPQSDQDDQAQNNTATSPAGAQDQTSDGPRTIEILHGEHAGVYSIYPVAAMLPGITGAAFDELKKSIAQYGQQEPAVVDGDWFLDGRHRVQIMNELGREPVVVQFASLKTGLTPEQWIMVKNKHRRQMTDDQALAFAEKALAWVEHKKQAWMMSHTLVQAGRNRESAEAANPVPEPEESESQANGVAQEFPQKPAENPPKRKRGRPTGTRSRAEAAAKAVGQTRYRGEQITRLRGEAPELAEAVLSGELKLKQAMAQIKERQKPQGTEMPNDPTGRTPDPERVRKAIRAGWKALGDVLKRVRKCERGPVWLGIAEHARREASMCATGTAQPTKKGRSASAKK